MEDKENQGAAAPQMQLTIDRARWLRGTDKGYLLRSSDGKMCCLGFYGVACGIPPATLADRGMPDEAAPESWPEWMVERESGDDEAEPYISTTLECDSLATTNDNSAIGEAEREEKVARLFAKHGVTVEFVGDAAPAAPKEPRP